MFKVGQTVKPNKNFARASGVPHGSRFSFHDLFGGTQTSQVENCRFIYIGPNPRNRDEGEFEVLTGPHKGKRCYRYYDRFHAVRGVKVNLYANKIRK